MTDLPQDDSEAAFARVFEHEVEVSQEISARSRKNLAILLRAIKSKSVVGVAETLGVSPSAISRAQSSAAVTSVMSIMAAAGLKVVPVDALVYVRPEEYE